MRSISLIHSRKIKTELGKEMKLEYYLINDSVLNGCAECYGVEVRARAPGGGSYAGIPYITMIGSRIFQLLDRLAECAVTPQSLYAVIEDWLC